MQVIRIAGCVAATLLLFAAAPRIPERAPILGANVAPLSYDLTLAPDITAATQTFGLRGTVEGRERIVVTLRRSASEIALNATHIAVLRAAVDGRVATVSVDPVAQQIVLRAAHPLAAGRHVVTLGFRSRIAGDVPGFFGDSMEGHAQDLVSSFEPSEARSLFPCFDEPGFRARFTLHVIAPRGWTVISSMAAVGSTPLGADRKDVSFAATPPIPPYLLALDMGVFASVRGSIDGVPVTVYARPGQTALARRTLDTALTALHFYARDLGVPYPFPKLDIVISDGVLNDTEEAAGVETVYTEDEVSGAQRSGLLGAKDAFDAIAQPIALEWFAGITSQRTWGDSWVVYGPAQWELARARRALRPDLAGVLGFGWSWTGYSGRPLAWRLADDRDAAVQPLYDDLFARGPAILAMWARYVGVDAVHAALRRYFAEHRFGSAAVDGFWRSFGSPAALAYGRAWIERPDAPVLIANAACAGGIARVQLEQAPYHRARGRAAALWPIPVTIAEGSSDRTYLFTARRQTIDVGACAGPISLNEGLRPPYPALASGFASGATEIDGSRRFEDTFALYRKGVAPLRALISATSEWVRHGYLEATRPALWALVDDARLLQGSSAQPRFDRMLAPLVRELALHATTPPTGLLPSLGAVGAADQLLSWLPHPPGVRAALERYRHREPGSYDPNAWGEAELAAAAATPADIARALQSAPPDGLGLYPFTWTMLGALRGRGETERVLTAAMHANTLRYVLPSLGARHPRLVRAFLMTHVHALLREVPPTKQSWLLRDVVVHGAWSASSPQAWNGFFARTMPRNDAATRRAAVAAIAAKWMARRRLEARLHEAAVREPLRARDPRAARRLGGDRSG